MPDNDLQGRIARLKVEFEHLSAQHSEHEAQIPPTASPELREAHARRANILKRRIHLLKAELNRLRRLSETASRKQPRGSEIAH